MSVMSILKNNLPGCSVYRNMLDQKIEDYRNYLEEEFSHFREEPAYVGEYIHEPFIRKAFDESFTPKALSWLTEIGRLMDEEQGA